jgi:ribonucleoside-diphosphate reductase alpha chain
MEQPLPPYGACLLGSVNLVKMVDGPFEKSPMVNQSRLEETVRAAVRLLDKVIDISNFPIPEQKAEALYKRRMGLGITGLADMLFMMNLNYNSQDGINLAELVMKIIAITAYEESIELAKEFGPCPATETKEQREAFCKSGFMKQMPEHIHLGVMEHGIRNALLTSIAPTGTISLYAGNVSSGIEPVFAPSYTRKVLEKDGSKREELVEDYAVKLYHEWRENIGIDKEPNPPHLVTAQTLDPLDHILMQSAVQKWVDSSISKTINVPEDILFKDFKRVYTDAYAMGCKGCTTYRPNEVTGSVISIEKDEPEKTDEAPNTFDESAHQEYFGTADTAPRQRMLNGQTYKLKWEGSNFYVTINNRIQNGRLTPFEIFINTQDMSHFQWTVALTRMMSSVFRRNSDIQFVIEDLKSIMDPNGGAWVDGKYMPSFIALLGRTLEQHLDFLSDGGQTTGPDEEINFDPQPTVGKPMQCTQCKGFNVHLSGGCPVCADCGHSKCG